MVDRMRGVYNLPSSDPIGRMAQRAAGVAKAWNYMRMMGGVVPSSVMDVGRIVLAEGFVNTFNFALKPLVKNLGKVKAFNDDFGPYTYYLDSFTGGRANVIADIEHVAYGETKLEAAIQAGAKKFSRINLMNQWTAMTKCMHGMVVQTRVSKELLAGKYDPRLGQLGISEADSINIAEQLKKFGRAEGDVYIANVKDWDNSALGEMWMGALRKESDRVIMMPGQDKPLFMSRDMGATLLQFKTFMLSATTRITASTLQRQDAHMIEGWMSIMGLSMMSYAFKEWDAGREVSDDPKVWVAEAIDRSGALGIVSEIDNTLTKVSGDNFGLRPMMGINGHSSRYASRSAVESMLGPTYGLAMDTVFRGTNELLSSKENGGRSLDERDARAIRRLLPMQNFPILRQAFDKIEKAAN
jgi:hypothetical protein